GKRRIAGVICKECGGERLEEEVVVAHLDLVDGLVAKDLRERPIQLIAWPRRRLRRRWRLRGAAGVTRIERREEPGHVATHHEADLRGELKIHAPAGLRIR